MGTQDVDNPETLATLGTQDVDNPETLATLGTQDVDNPETLATLGTQGVDKQNTTQHRKLKNEQHRPHQKPGVNLGAHEWYRSAVLL